jgi:hypothetical protein
MANTLAYYDGALIKVVKKLYSAGPQGQCYKHFMAVIYGRKMLNNIDPCSDCYEQFTGINYLCTKISFCSQYLKKNVLLRS